MKVRGFRVELGEIEAQLARHPGVREALALVRDDTPGGRQLVAYCAAARKAPEPDELRRHLRQSLPDYMVPTFLVCLEALPLTPNGKVDRRGLPIPAHAEGRDVARPRTPMEEILAAVWSEVLGLPGIGPDDNFFALGGHSLKATQVASRLRERLGIELPLRRIFEAPSLAVLREPRGGLADRPEAPGLADRAVPPSGEGGAAALFRPGADVARGAARARDRRLQHGAGPGDPGPPGCPHPGTRRHRDRRASRGAAHRFALTEAGPVQVIEPRVALALPVVDLSELPEAIWTREVRRLAGEAARHPFELTAAPLLRVSLVRRGATDHQLLVAMHHIVSDGWSMGVFLQELAQLYEDFAAARPLAAAAADPVRGFRPLAARVARGGRRWNPCSATGAGGSPARRWCWSCPPIAAASRAQLARRQPLPPAGADLQAALKALSQRHGATLFMTLLAAFKVLLWRYSGKQDILVGTDIANRNRRELEGLIGFFVNHPVLRTDLSGNPTFAELLDRVRRRPGGLRPPGPAVREAGRGAAAGAGPEPAAALPGAVRAAERAAGKSPHLGPRPDSRAVDSGRCKFDLMLMMWEVEDGLLETWSYSTDLFEESTIARMSGHLEALLRQVVSRPDARLNDLEISTEQERARRGMEREQRQNLEASTLRLTRRRSVDLSTVSPIATRVLEGGETSCLVIEPARQDVDLVGWAQDGRDFVEANLATYGAILFRGFPVGGVAEFESFAQAVCPALFDEYGDLPRAGLGGKVYTSTPYPPDQWILYHNESSHMDRWPLKQFFHCVQPAESGGETPIADCRRVYQRLDPELLRAFAERGVMYVRNFTPGIDVSWQEFFHTGDRAEVERHAGPLVSRWSGRPTARCARAGSARRWRGIRRPARPSSSTRSRPTTSPAWIPRSGNPCSSLFPEDALPRNAYFGDGKPIESSMMEEIVGVYHQVAVGFPWLKGDILVVDNMLTAHSRAPFAGARKIVVAMGEMVGA